jgi:hypothetical protein
MRASVPSGLADAVLASILGNKIVITRQVLLTACQVFALSERLDSGTSHHVFYSSNRSVDASRTYVKASEGTSQN